MQMTDWLTTLQESVTTSISLMIAFLPKLLGAAVLLLLGYLLARLVAAGTAALLRVLGLDRVLAKTPVQAVLDRAGARKAGSEMLGILAFWLIFLLFAISAAETLGLSIISTALTDLAYYLPKVGVAVLIIVLGLLVANFIKELIGLACSSAGIPQGAIVAQTFYVAAILVIVVTAINELGIDTTLLNSTIIIAFGGLIAGAALSFGLGARSAVANLIASHYLQPMFRVGQTVRIDDVRGEVVALTPIAVVLETTDGRVVIPAARFHDCTTTIERSAN